MMQPLLTKRLFIFHNQATLKKQATRKKDNDRAKAYRAEALVINAAREAKLSASLASASLWYSGDQKMSDGLW